TEREDNWSSLPTLSLVTHCEPTGARRWFPCFDEPDKKATFRLTITHPNQLTAYSNTEVENKVINNRVSTTSFEQTVPLPSYVLALALTEQSTREVIHNGYTVRTIGSTYYSGSQ
ncbi:hypothetical protein PENTCL1PPCAC_6136, partial [Pristionchus entomophagus]